jgi:hypothetical protein
MRRCAVCGGALAYEGLEDLVGLFAARVAVQLMMCLTALHAGVVAYVRSLAVRRPGPGPRCTVKAEVSNPNAPMTLLSARTHPYVSFSNLAE